MNNNDERDYAEEADNRKLLRNPDDLDKPIYSDEERKSNTWWNFGYSTREWGVMSESAQEVEDGYMDLSGPEWEDLDPQAERSADDSPYRTEQTQTFVLGHSGHVNVSWHIINNVNEEYVSAMSEKSYILPALDGSTLYVWASLHLTDEAAHAWAGSATGQFEMKYSQFNTIWL